MINLEIDLDKNNLPIIHALDSETRIDIINLLIRQPATITELSQKLHYSKAVISKHARILERAGLIQQSELTTSDKRRRVLFLKTDNILINMPERIYPQFEKFSYNIPLGNYFNTDNIRPTCGMASVKQVIGKFDDPNIFLTNDRFSASLLWFSSGFVEYIIPNNLIGQNNPELIDISFEISSEFPQSNNNWPSDISFWLNNVKLGTWTVSGNYSDVRGILTPKWWGSDFSQYGLLKHLRILKSDTAMDGEHISDVTINDLGLDHTKTIRLKIGIDPESRNQGGLTLFGRDFGNYKQDINFSCFYSKN